MTTSPAVWARSGFALGYAEDGSFPIPGRVARECIAVQESSVEYPGPDLMRLVVETGRTEGKRAARYDGHRSLYDDHSAALAALWLAVLKRLDLDLLVPSVVAVAVQQEATGADPVARRKAVQAAVVVAVLAALTSDDRQAITDANAAGWSDAYARGTAEAEATPANGGPPDPKKVAVLMAAALALVPQATASSAAATWAIDQIDVTAMGVALAAGDGAGASEATKRVTQALLDTGRTTRAYADNLHRVVMESYVAQLQTRYPSRLMDFITMGDGRVCPLCYEIEGSNPWPADSVELPPVHFSCRCHLEMASESVAV